MRVCERSALTMTQLSVKIGRFTPGPGVGDAKVFRGRIGCDVDDEDDVRRAEEEAADDVTLPSRTRSSSDLRSYFSISRKFSLPDFQVRGFKCADPDLVLDLDLDPPEVEVMMEGEGEGELGADPNGMPWLDFYSRTPRANEDDRMLDILNRCVRPRDSTDSCDGPEDSGTPGVPQQPLPWRTAEALPALEDGGSKYLFDGSEFFNNADEATPQIRFEESGGDHHHHNHHHHRELHPLASFNQPSSSSRSGSFRKIPSFDSVPRPDLSACHSLSVSHWLSEAESRHSEPFCLPHHHLDPSTSGAGHRSGLQNPPHQRRCCQRDRLHHSGSSSSSSSSSSETSFIPDDGEELDRPGHRDQVLKWLLTYDLEATAVLDESDDHHSLEDASGLIDI